ATLGDAMRAVKERVIGEPSLDDDERTQLAALDGSLDKPVAPDSEPALRAFCGVLLSTPQFELAGLAPNIAGAGASPLLTSAKDACASTKARGIPGFDVSCSDAGALSVKKAETPAPAGSSSP